MQIVTSPPPDRRLIAAAIRRRSAASLWVIRGFGVVVVLASTFNLLASVAMGLFGIVFGLLMIFGFPALLVSRAADRCWQIYRIPGAYTITDWGVERTDALTRQGFAWAALSGVDPLPGQLLFLIGKAGFLPMSTAALAPGEAQHILGMAAHYGVTAKSRS